MSATLKVGGQQVGAGHPCYVIAEAGVNHNGSLELAKELVLAARAAGADAVKFQTFKAENLVTLQAEKANYQKVNLGRGGTQMEMLQALELADDAFVELKAFCESHHIGFLSTPYGETDIDLLDRIGVDAFKIASALSVEPRFVKYCCSKGKPVILATGMATMEELRATMAVLSSEETSRVALLQCTTNYPAHIESANLKVIATLEAEFGCVSGYSDHTPGELTALMAVALGAAVIERHLTLDKQMEGPDHQASSDPEELKRYIGQIRQAQSALGSGEKIPSEEELENVERMRRGIVMAAAVKAGEQIESSHLCCKRPAKGIQPREWDQVVGRRAACDLAADEILTWEKLSP